MCRVAESQWRRGSAQPGTTLKHHSCHCPLRTSPAYASSNTSCRTSLRLQIPLRTTSGRVPGAVRTGCAQYDGFARGSGWVVSGGDSVARLPFTIPLYSYLIHPDGKPVRSTQSPPSTHGLRGYAFRHMATGRELGAA